MDLANIDEKIELLFTTIHTIEKTINRQKIINHHLELLYSDLTIHKSKLDKEHQDIVQLEKIPKTLLFQTILGNSKEQLEKERQEYLQAALEYNAIANEIELLQYEYELLDKKPKDTTEHKKQLDYYLKVKEQKLLFQNTKDTIEIIKLTNEIRSIKHRERKLKDAIKGANVVDNVIQKAYSKLEKVSSFGYSSMGGVGRYSSYAKKTFIDDAIKGISEINFFLSKLENELKEIYGQFTFFSIYRYQNFVESFYDNLITDYLLLSKLRNALNCLQSADDHIKRIIGTLENDISKSNESVQEITNRKHNLIRKS